jgi:superoxide reductase
MFGVFDKHSKKIFLQVKFCTFVVHTKYAKSEFLFNNLIFFNMPRVFKAKDIELEEKEVMKDYLDRHMPHVLCESTVKRGEKFKIKVRMGNEYPHPDDHDHYISTMQLWNRETLLAETKYYAGVQGNKPSNLEVDFYIVAPEVSMNLSAMAVCTKHGLWQSEDKAVKVV